MPSTKQLVTEIQSLAHGWNRDGERGILPILNEIVRYMVDHDSNNNIVVDATTGLPPLLSTVEDTYQYTMPNDCRKVIAIIYDPLYRDRAQDRDGYNRGRVYQEFGQVRGFYWFSGVKYKVARGTHRPRTRLSNATFTFYDNPETTDEKYLSVYYREHTNILQETTQIPIEEQYHDLVVRGTVARIRARQYGDLADWLDWKQTAVPNEYWMESNEKPAGSSLIPLKWA